MDRNKIEAIIKETEGFKIIAATKYIDTLEARELYSYGIHDFAENRVDEFLLKKSALSDLNITWHFIGHLQRNKAKKIINKIDYLHSLDDLDLLALIDKERRTPLNTFVELRLTGNDNKSGVKEEDLDHFMNELKNHKMVNVVGFMAMSDKGMSEDEIHKVFKKANELKNKYNLKYLSMGMSNDYRVAMEEGSTHLRLGRILYN